MHGQECKQWLAEDKRMKKNGVAETVTTTNLSNSDNTMNIKAGDAKVKTRSFNRSIHQREGDQYFVEIFP